MNVSMDWDYPSKALSLGGSYLVMQVIVLEFRDYSVQLRFNSHLIV